MFLIYSDEKPKGKFEGGKFNSNNMYLKHFENGLYLTFIFTNSDNFSEKQRAGKELAICERKMKYWERMQDFDFPSLVPRLEAAKALWKGREK